MSEEKTIKEALAEMRQPGNRKRLLERADTYVLVQMSYSLELVLTRKNFIKFCEALEGAEMRDGEYGARVIRPLQIDKLNATMISEDSYLNHKMAHLLGITVRDIENADKPEEESDA